MPDTRVNIGWPVVAAPGVVVGVGLTVAVGEGLTTAVGVAAAPPIVVIMIEAITGGSSGVLSLLTSSAENTCRPGVTFLQA